jgi:hypothetical protein
MRQPWRRTTENKGASKSSVIGAGDSIGGGNGEREVGTTYNNNFVIIHF